MLLVLSSLLLTQVPASTVAVVVSNRTGVSTQRALKVAGWVQSALTERGLDASVPSRRAECRGSRSCAAEEGRALGVRAVVALDAAQMMDQLSVHLELIDSASGEVLDVDTLVVPATALPPAAVEPFAERAAAALVAPPALKDEVPAPASDAPVAAAPAAEPAPAPPEPAPREEPPPAVVVTASSARPPWVWAPGAAGVVLLATGTYFLINAASETQQIWNLQPATASDMKAVAAQATQDRAVGAVCVGAGVLGLAATYVLFRANGPDEEASLSLGPSASGWQLTAAGRWR